MTLVSGQPLSLLRMQPKNCSVCFLANPSRGRAPTLALMLWTAATALQARSVSPSPASVCAVRRFRYSSVANVLACRRIHGMLGDRLTVPRYLFREGITEIEE